MTEYLHRNFLTDKHDFESSKELYRQAILAAGSAARQVTSLKPWLDCDFRVIPGEVSANVYSTYNETASRGILITQWSPTASGKDIEAFIDTFGDSAYPGDQREFLQVHCKLSAKTLDLVRTIAEPWLFKGASHSNMRALIERSA